MGVEARKERFCIRAVRCRSVCTRRPGCQTKVCDRRSRSSGRRWYPAAGRSSPASAAFQTGRLRSFHAVDRHDGHVQQLPDQAQRRVSRRLAQRLLLGKAVDLHQSLDHLFHALDNRLLRGVFLRLEDQRQPLPGRIEHAHLHVHRQRRAVAPVEQHADNLIHG